MKALSLTRPWSMLAALGEKGWETRSRRFHHYGHTAIHSSDGFPKNLRAVYPGGLEEVCGLPFFKDALAAHGYFKPEQLPSSAIIGVVEIVRYVRTERIRDELTEKERAFGLYSSGRWAYELSNPRLISPVACKGQLGLWNVPGSVLEKIREQNPDLVTTYSHSLPFSL